MKEKSMLQLCNSKKCLILLINELKNDILLYEKCFKEILTFCHSCTVRNISKNEIIEHLLTIPTEEVPKKIIFETILNFPFHELLPKCLIV